MSYIYNHRNLNNQISVYITVNHLILVQPGNDPHDYVKIRVSTRPKSERNVNEILVTTYWNFSVLVGPMGYTIYISIKCRDGL